MLAVNRKPLILLLLLAGSARLGSFATSSSASSQAGSADVWDVRFIYTAEYGVVNPGSLAFSPGANAFLVWGANGDITAITMAEDLVGAVGIATSVEKPLNAAFDDHTNSLFVLNRDASELAQISVTQSGLPDPAAKAIMRFNTRAFGVRQAAGITFDPQTGRLFVLDAAGAQIVAIAPHPVFGFDGDAAVREGRVQRINLTGLGNEPLRGIAFNPNDGHVYVSEPGLHKLYELSGDGQVVATFDLSELGLKNPQTLLFAPSVDRTDDPASLDLFILDSGPATAPAGASPGGQIVELSLLAPAALPPGTTLWPTTLVHIIDTSNAAWSPSAPDPAGVDYWPLTGRLLISDSEVDEMPPYWMGKNVFESTTSGTLVSTCSTMSYTSEPTGVAINPNNNHIFFSTDANDSVFEVTRGGDRVYCTADDTVTSTNVSTLYGITDAEDVAYGNNTVFIAGGVDAEVYRIPLGANRVLGGGDDGPMTHFDTDVLGFQNVEGIGYNWESGTLFIVSALSGNRYLGETTTTGTLLNAYDLPHAGLVHPEDVTFAPGSQNPAVKNVYLTSRGVDNVTDPNENDGKVYEISLLLNQVFLPTTLKNR